MRNVFLELGSRLLSGLLLALLIWGCESDADNTQPPVPPPNLDKWTQQQSFTVTPIQDIHFVDNSFGWAVGENLVLSTSSGGELWQRPPLESSTQPNIINSIYFIDQETGWMAGSGLESERWRDFHHRTGRGLPGSSTNLSGPIDGHSFHR